MTIGRAGRLWMVVVAAVMACVLAAPAWAAAAGHPVDGRRLTPPRGAARAPITLAHSGAHGVVYRGDSLQAKVVKADCSSRCVGPLFYWGGPVMSRPKAYAIYWNPSGAGTSFPSKYESTIDEFMENVQSTTSPLENAFSVDLLYGDKSVAGEYGWTYGGVIPDEEELPEREDGNGRPGEGSCPIATPEEEEKEEEGYAGLPPASELCVTDAQLRTQLENVVKGLPTGLSALYFIMTPKGVNSCAGGEGEEAECTTNVYCAYHWNTQAAKLRTESLIYANMPYADRPGCETPDQPNHNAADDEINVISHEGNEAITDPLGGEEEAAETGWLAYSGNEVADLCTYPFFDPISDVDIEEDAYGALIGGTRTAEYEPVEFEGETYYVLSNPGNSYNQEINGGRYLLQREWSNAAEGCVARAPAPVPSFASYPSSPVTGSPVSFNGSASSTAGHITGYEWSFGDGSGPEAGSQPQHTYSTPGTYTVTLTVYNNSGASATATRQLTVSAPPPPPAPEVRTTSVTTTTTVNVPVEATISRYSRSAVERSLGLPRNGKRLSGLGAIALGTAQCPPACGISVRMIAFKGGGRNSHGHGRPAVIGHMKETVENKGTGSISLRLTAKGRRLLHRARHGLHVTVEIVIEDREGAIWSMTRRLTLTSGAKAARSHTARHHR